MKTTSLIMPHNEREYRRLVKTLDSRVGKVGENESHPLASKMEVLGAFIKKYEDGKVAELV